MTCAKRFQFTLREMYLVLGLIAAAQVLLWPVLKDAAGIERPLTGLVVVLLTLLTCAGAGLGLWRAHERRTEGATNAGSILWYVAVAWAVAGLGMSGSLAALILGVPVTVGFAGAGMWLGGLYRKDLSARLRIAAATVCAGWGLLYGASAVLTHSVLRSHLNPHTNELAAIAMCQIYAEAQEIYRRTDWDGDGVLEYSTSITGNNSLFEKHAGSGDLTLVDAAFANAEGDPGTAQPKAGYVYRVLKRQGPHAPGGAMSYFDERGNLAHGFAIMACPAAYGALGRYSFIVSNEGTVYMKDLGPDSAKIYLETDAYDPDESWVIAE